MSTYFASAPLRLWILMSRTSSLVIENMFICNYKFAISQQPPLARANAETCCMRMESINSSARLWIHVLACMWINMRRRKIYHQGRMRVWNVQAPKTKQGDESPKRAAWARDQRAARVTRVMWVECLLVTRSTENLLFISRDFDIAELLGKWMNSVWSVNYSELKLHHNFCCWFKWGNA